MSEELHVKWRPKQLADVVGQGHITKPLQATIKNGTCHSFIFTGDSGCGKTTLARIVASEVGCTEATITEIDAATHTGIDAMREVVESTRYSRGFGGGAKMIIIDEAHALSKAAWQSLLKAIEEPPAHVYWALCTTEPGKIPPTIKTRCQCFQVKPVQPDTLFDLIAGVADKEQLTITDDAIDALVSKAGGSPRRALTWLGQCADAQTRKEALAIIAEDAGEHDGVFELCQLLTKGASWKAVAPVLTNLKEDGVAPEGIRRTINAYFAKVALGAKADPTPALAVLEAFKTPCYDTDYAPIVLAFGGLLFGE